MRDWICGFFMAWGMFLAIPCPRKIWSESAEPLGATVAPS